MNVEVDMRDRIGKKQPEQVDNKYRRVLNAKECFMRLFKGFIGIFMVAAVLALAFSSCDSGGGGGGGGGKPAHTHDWGDWEVTKPATATEDGEETRVCSTDPSHKETRAIPKLGGEGIKVTITGLPDTLSGVLYLESSFSTSPFELKAGYSQISDNSVTVELRIFDNSFPTISDWFDNVKSPVTGELETVLGFAVEDTLLSAYQKWQTDLMQNNHQNTYIYTNGSDEQYYGFAECPKITLSSESVTTIDFSKFKLNAIAQQSP
jgi:hypothetical protein